jgi:hypothetical protein
MKCVLTFQGFRESEDRRSGTEDLFFDVIRKFSDSDCTTYHPRNWNSDVKTLARQLSRQGIRQVALVSYSHGQAAAAAFARLAYDTGIKVPLWLACDPVYRPTWLPRWNILQPLAFKAMLATGSIHVPRNIKRVAWARQTSSRPCGHDLVADSPYVVQEPLILPYSHTAIDHAPEWYSLVRRELDAWINPKANMP